MLTRRNIYLLCIARSVLFPFYVFALSIHGSIECRLSESGAPFAEATASFHHIHSWGGELNTFMIGSTATLTTFRAWYLYTTSHRGRVARYPVGSAEWRSANDDRWRG